MRRAKDDVDHLLSNRKTPPKAADQPSDRPVPSTCPRPFMGIACGAARAAHSIDARLRGTHMNILTVNLLLSTLVFGIAAKIYILPKLHRLPVRTILLPILLLHSLRHLGLMFLAPGAIYAGMPRQFAYPAAFGDLLAAALALIALAAVAAEARSARLLVWLFNI